MLRQALPREKFIFFVIIPVLVMTNLLLLRQNLHIRGMVSKDYSHLDMLQSGDQAVPFEADLLEGGRIRVDFSPGGEKWVFLYFSSRCRYSYEQFPYWRYLIEQSRSGGFQVLGLVSEHENPQKVRELLKSMKAGPLAVARIPDSVYRRYKLLITPLTLTVDSRGRVEKNWVGRWGFRTMQEAAQLLKLD